MYVIIEQLCAYFRGMLRFREVGPALFCSLVLCFGCTRSAEERVKGYFGIEKEKEASEDEIKQAILERIPTGSSVEDVCAVLDRAGVVKDRYSDYSRPWQDHVFKNSKDIYVYIGLAPELFRRVYREYTVVFQMGTNGLTNVVVGAGLTGP